jgi:spermidine/putrescine transport system substrate-binding protein
VKKILLFIALSFCSIIAIAETKQENKTLNIYVWAGYVPESILYQFTKETGIVVNHSTYSNNEILYAKLKINPNAAYDLIIPSSYFIPRLLKQDLLQKLDHSKISSLKQLNPLFLNKSYDPNNNYSIPYLWHAAGIVVNDKFYDPNNFSYFKDLWTNSKPDSLLLLDDTREVFSMALLKQGYLSNDLDPEHVKEAYQHLKDLMPKIKLFNTDAQRSIYIDEDISIGMGWSGDLALAQKENSHLHFIYPKEGFVLSLDAMVIPKGAQHLENAYRFINFVLRPDIAAQISVESGFSSPNLAALKLLPPELQNSPLLYPSEEILKRGTLQTDAGKASIIFEKYFELLKLNN